MKVLIQNQKLKKWTADEKFEIIKPALDMEKSTLQIAKEIGLNNGMINNWIKKYREKGYEGLVPKTKHDNPLAKYCNKKNLTKEEQLEYENIIGYNWNTSRPFEKVVSDTTSFYFKKKKYD